jgi:hypothetical protein
MPATHLPTPTDPNNTYWPKPKQHNTTLTTSPSHTHNHTPNRITLPIHANDAQRHVVEEATADFVLREMKFETLLSLQEYFG